MTCRIESDGNKIEIIGRFGMMDFHRVLAALHNMTTKRGYQDIVLDFGACTAAFSGPMISLCTAIGALRYDGVDVDLRLPNKRELANLFKNASWAYLIDPGAFQESTYKSNIHLPAIQFSSPREQQNAVNRMVDRILGSLPDLRRGDLAAIEWSLNEITDNVLTHSQSRVGGVVQLSHMRTRRRVEFAVSDAGLGIPHTLRAGHPGIRSDPEALDRAIREGVTRDRSLGQGNGLFGTFQITRISEGYFHVHSGYARLDFDDGVHIRTESIPCKGTLVVACIDLSKRAALQEALRFGGELHRPVDYVETHYESRSADELIFSLHEEAASLGSRFAGEPVRTKLENIAKMSPGARIIIDFSQVPICSSSFADEVFGKLFVALGAIEFMRRFELRGLSSTVRSLVDRAIMQRSTLEP